MIPFCAVSLLPRWYILLDYITDSSSENHSNKKMTMFTFVSCAKWLTQNQLQPKTNLSTNCCSLYTVQALMYAQYIYQNALLRKSVQDIITIWDLQSTQFNALHSYNILTVAATIQIQQADI